MLVRLSCSSPLWFQLQNQDEYLFLPKLQTGIFNYLICWVMVEGTRFRVVDGFYKTKGPHIHR